MLANQAGSTPENSLGQKAALVILIAVVAAATLFPETFIEDFPLVGTELTFPLSLLMPLVFIAAVVMVVHERASLRFHPVDAIVLAYSVYLLARNFAGELPFFTIKFVLISLAVYYLTAALSSYEVQLRRIFVSVSVIALLAAIYGLAEFAAQDNFLYQPFISFGRPDDELHRVGSFLAHPVVYGAVLVQVLPFTVLLWVRGWTQRLRILGLAATLLSVLGLFLTFSKGSWISAFLVVLAATIYFVRTRGKRNVSIALALLLLAGLLAGLYLNRSELQDIVRFESSVGARANAWEAALRGIGDHPVLGVGLKQGEPEIDEQLPQDVKDVYKDFKPPTDNYFINVFLEGGVIGGLLWLALMVLVVFGGFRQTRRKRRARYMLVAAFLSVVGLLINMVTFDAMLIWSNLVLFWLAAGILRGSYGDGGEDRLLER